MIKYNHQKSECSKRQQSWGIWVCFVGSKEHLNWLIIDLNAAEIIFKTINTHKINVNGSAHIKC